MVKQMGMIRVLLAISVICSHTGSHALIGGQASVQCFYVISGFLISYALNNTPSYGSIYSFYINRFLRLYPTYWFIALLTLGAYALALVFGVDQKLHDFLGLPMSAQWLIISTNILIFGQDTLLFLGLKDNTLEFVMDFRSTSPQLWKFALLPQAWSLGLELTFYLTAPFILRSRAMLFSCLGASLLGRGAALAAGFGWEDPWTYRFFPFELSLFLLGAVVQQILSPAIERLCEVSVHFERLALAAFVLTMLIFPLVDVSTALRTAILILLLALSLPLLFVFQKHNRWDRSIGELSYPIYISHWLVVLFVKTAAKIVGLDYPQPVLTVCVIALTTAFSAGVNSFFASRVDKLREVIREGGLSRIYTFHSVKEATSP